MEKQKRDPRSKLMQALDFSQADLEANRQGYMTYQQREKMLPRTTVVDRGVTAFSIFCGVAALAAIIISGNSVMTLVFFVVILFLEILTVLLLETRAKDNQISIADLKKGHVESIEGIVTERSVKKSARGTYYEYFLDIQDEEFKVSFEAFKAFIYAERYILYYTPISRTVVSAERCNKDNISS